MNEKQYDIALSFAGEDREYVKLNIQFYLYPNIMQKNYGQTMKEKVHKPEHF